MVSKPASQTLPQSKRIDFLPLEEIQKAVESIRFGSVQLIIQDGRIVQIDVTDKKRLI